jgi:hypothetical protein
MLPEETIKNLDLCYLEKRLRHKFKWSSEEAAHAVRRYKNFLILILKYPKELLAPAPDIDEVWHNHILFTREYFRDTQEIFGGYLHHSPADPDDQSIMEEAQWRTADLYHKEFNEPFFLELNVSSFW